MPIDVEAVLRFIGDDASMVAAIQESTAELGNLDRAAVKTKAFLTQLGATEVTPIIKADGTPAISIAVQTMAAVQGIVRQPAVIDIVAKDDATAIAAGIRSAVMRDMRVNRLNPTEGLNLADAIQKAGAIRDLTMALNDYWATSAEFNPPPSIPLSAPIAGPPDGMPPPPPRRTYAQQVQDTLLYLRTHPGYVPAPPPVDGPPVMPAPGGGGGGAGRSILAALLFGGKYGRGGNGGSGGRGLLWGGGSGIPFLGAAAGFGSLGMLAGFGAERILMTGVGLAGSLGGAALGGGALAAGAAAPMAVGGGADMIVMKSTIADTKLLNTAYTNLWQAQLLYGKGSTQAAAATLALNQQMAILGNTAGVKAQLALAQAANVLNQKWDQATSNARVIISAIGQDALKVAGVYMPMVANSATRNFGIIRTGLQPLFAWLKGPQATGIFNDLENIFARRLPTALDTLNQFVQLVFKSLDYLANKTTGGLMQKLDAFLTRMNGADWAKWTHGLDTIVGMFHTWAAFFVMLGKDIFQIFSMSAGVGTTIISTLTGMLTQLHNWLTSSSGQNQVRSVFQAHLAEIKAILQLIPVVVGGFGKIYLALAPILTMMATNLINAVVPIITAIASNPFGAWLLTIGLILLKLGALGSVMKGLGIAALLSKIPVIGGLFSGLVSGNESAAATNMRAALINQASSEVNLRAAQIQAGASTENLAGNAAGDVGAAAGGGSLLSRLGKLLGIGGGGAAAAEGGGEAALGVTAGLSVDTLASVAAPVAATILAGWGVASLINKLTGQNMTGGSPQDLLNQLNQQLSSHGLKPATGPGSTSYTSDTAPVGDVQSTMQAFIQHVEGMGVSTGRALTYAQQVEQAFEKGKTHTASDLQTIIDAFDQHIVPDSLSTKDWVSVIAGQFGLFKDAATASGPQWAYDMKAIASSLATTLQHGSNVSLFMGNMANLLGDGTIKTAAQMQTYEQNWNNVQQNAKNADGAQAMLARLMSAGQITSQGQVNRFISSWNTILQNSGGIEPSLAAIESSMGTAATGATPIPGDIATLKNSIILANGAVVSLMGAFLALIPNTTTSSVFGGHGYITETGVNGASGGPPTPKPVGSGVGHLAAGGGGSGPTWVGETGPELLNLPMGSRVTPSVASMRMLRVPLPSTMAPVNFNPSFTVNGITAEDVVPAMRTEIGKWHAETLRLVRR